MLLFAKKISIILLLVNSFILPASAQFYVNSNKVLSESDIEARRKQLTEEWSKNYPTMDELKRRKEQELSKLTDEEEIKRATKEWDRTIKNDSLEGMVEKNIKNEIATNAINTFEDIKGACKATCSLHKDSSACRKYLKDMEEATNALASVYTTANQKKILERYQNEFNAIEALTKPAEEKTETPEIPTPDANETPDPTVPQESATVQDNTESEKPTQTTFNAGTQTPKSQTEITGCEANFGLFSGLVTTGREIFEGLRDLIYVVAGFGILGVAIGGFFGNMNWKWLGAIIISLVIIATTGELIAAITGCTNFSSTLIQDTLR